VTFRIGLTDATYMGSLWLAWGSTAPLWPLYGAYAHVNTHKGQLCLSVEADVCFAVADTSGELGRRVELNGFARLWLSPAIAISLRVGEKDSIFYEGKGEGRRFQAPMARGHP
jgi:hypothetical protein